MLSSLLKDRNIVDTSAQAPELAMTKYGGVVTSRPDAKFQGQLSSLDGNKLKLVVFRE